MNGVIEKGMTLLDKLNVAPPAGYATIDDFMRSALTPAQPIPPFPEPIPFEVTWKMVQDVGHEEDAYFKLGWRCISRHGKHALLVKDDLTNEKPLEFLIMVGA